MLSVELFEPTPHCKLLAHGKNRKRRVHPFRITVIMRIIGESTRILPVGIHHVDFRRGPTEYRVNVPIPLRREDNSFTIRRP